MTRTPSIDDYDNEDYRATFEAAMRDMPDYEGGDLKRNSEGRYESVYTRGAWYGWRVAIKPRPAQPVGTKGEF